MCVAPGAVRQRGPQGKGVPKDHPAPCLWKTTGPPSLHPQTDQQHLPQVQAAFHRANAQDLKVLFIAFSHQQIKH